MPLILKFLNKSFGTYNIHGIYIEPNYWEAGVIILLLFLLVFTLARVRYLYIHWSLGKGTLSFLFYGFLLALILEGFLILSGRTLFTEVIGWKNVPKPLSTVLDAGRNRLVKVLGVQDQIPLSEASEIPNAQSVLNVYENLRSKDKNEVKTYICKP